MRRRALLSVVGNTIVTPTESYTRLTYIEATGTQYIEVDYQLQEDDTIDVLFENLSTSSGDKFLFGTTNTWVDANGSALYIRFGHSSSTKVVSGVWKRRVELSKGKVVFDGVDTTPLEYTGIREGKISIFNGVDVNNNSKGLHRIFYFRIIGSNGSAIIDLTPAKRDSDGKIGMIDLVSGVWYGNVGSGEDFVCGNELSITEGYELIDRVTFNKDKAFDTGYQGNNKTYIDIMFQRTDTSAACYLFGCSPSNKARITAYLSTSGAWRYGTSLYKGFTIVDEYIRIGRVTPTGITVDDTKQTYTSSSFTTVQDIPLGGHRSSESSATVAKTFVGYIYYFRMKHGDTLLLDWYPCRRKSDGEEGFWDCVTQTFIAPM